MAEWNIQSRATACAQCGAAFTPEGAGHSLLLASEAGGLMRRDLCEACFKALPAEAETQAEAVWAFRVPPEAPTKSKEAPIQKETAESLLRKLLAAPEGSYRDVAYVLAILMERSKQFVERSLSLDGQGRKVRLYEQRRTGDLFPIVDPGLSPEDLPQVQQRVLELLEHPELLTPRVAAKPRRIFRHRTLPQRLVLRKVFR